ncbi:MAG: DUF6992 family protein [Archangium sp.]
MTLALVAALTLSAQPFDLTEWNKDRLTTSRVGMITLSSWAVANMGVGAFGAALETDERWRAFHVTNLVWNSVNLALGLISLIREWDDDPARFTAKQSLVFTEGNEKVFFINAALDLGYLAAAAFLWQRGDATGTPWLVGAGQALLIQGGFLVLFDGIMGILNARLTGRLLEGVEVNVTPVGVAGRF